MGQYRQIAAPLRANTASGSNMEFQTWSTHCLDGQHDYGFSAKCDCWCHWNNPKMLSSLGSAAG